MPLDQDTVAELLSLRRGEFLAYVRSIVGDRELAEDVFQDTSIIAVSKSDRIENIASFGYWFRAAARLEAFNALRKRNRLPVSFDQQVLDLLDEHWETSEQTKGSNSVLEALKKCIMLLTPRAQEMVRLRYEENLKGSSLAEYLGCSVNTACVGLSRIHRRLKSCVQAKVEKNVEADLSLLGQRCPSKGQ